MSTTYDVAVIGGGPAGCAAAIAARRRGLRVLLLEAARFPRHKVCGEFVSAESAEVLQYLLGSSFDALANAPRVTRARLHSGDRSVEIPVTPSAYSIPRYVLDEALWNASIASGIDCKIETVDEVIPGATTFGISGRSAEHVARHVINASGRWSRLTRRDHPGRETWIGLKAHFEADTDDAVDLYFLRAGYCGVQAVAPGVLNACALMRQGSARSLHEVFALSTSLARRSRSWKQRTEMFATAPVLLGPGDPIYRGMFQAGDAAGFVDPFVGDGISLALRSGVLAGRSVGLLKESDYAAVYRRAFAGIFRNSQRTRQLIQWSRPLSLLVRGALHLPAVSRTIFRNTRQARLDVLSVPLP